MPVPSESATRSSSIDKEMEEKFQGEFSIADDREEGTEGQKRRRGKFMGCLCDNMFMITILVGVAIGFGIGFGAKNMPNKQIAQIWISTWF